MANNLKTSPVGIDVVVDRLQQLIYDGVDWDTNPMATTTYDSYPRIYKNPVQGGDRPEYFIGDRDYKEVLLDDNFSGTSFFTVSDERNLDDVWSAQLSIIFQLNLAELYPAIPHRADEEAHQTILNLLYDNIWNYEVSGLVVGVPNVYSEFDFSQSIFDDMEKFHVFRINLNITYEYGCK